MQAEQIDGRRGRKEHDWGRVEKRAEVGEGEGERLAGMGNRREAPLRPWQVKGVVAR